MKFDELLEIYKIPEWDEYYFEYEQLKKKIKELQVNPLPKTKNSSKDVTKNLNLKKINSNDAFEMESIKRSKTAQVPSHKHENINSDYIENLSKVKKFLQEYFDELNLDFDIIKKLVDENQIEDVIENKHKFKKIKLENNYNSEGKSFNRDEAAKESIKKLYLMTSWLKNFTIVNSIASFKLIKKYKRIKHINNRTQDGLELESFNHQMNYHFHKIIKDVEHLHSQIISLYSNKYCQKNIWRSIKELNQAKRNLPSKVRATLYILMIVNILIFICYFLITYVPNTINSDSIEEISVFFPGFSFCFNILILFYLLTFDLYLFKKYRINYIYLLELNRKFQLFIHEILRTIMSLSILIGILMQIYRICLSFYYESCRNILFVFPIIGICIMFIFILFPFKLFSYEIRKSIWIQFWRSISPIGKKRVKFKDSLFADILTSIIRPFQIMTVAFCLASCNECKEKTDKVNCSTYNWAAFALILIPFFMRFFQCVNKFHFTKMKWPHLVNVFKYTVAILNIIVVYLTGMKYIETKIPLIISQSISSSYSLFFDFTVDWNVFNFKSKHFLLRDKLTFPQWFFYFAMITNTLLRFTWIIGLYKLQINSESLFFILSLLEIFRRAQWVLIRIENEQHHNIEMYRSYLMVPDLVKK